MLLLIKSSGLRVQSCSIIPFPGYPLCILGQVWYLIVSFPDLCRLSYFIKLTTSRCRIENIRYFIPIFMSPATQWTRLTMIRLRSKYTSICLPA